MTILQRLKSETLAEHKALENAYPFCALASRKISLVEYKDSLVLLACLHDALLVKVKPLTSTFFTAWTDHLKINLKALEADISELGGEVNAKGFHRLELSSEAMLAGSFYVVLGSSLGAKLIYRSLSQNQETWPMQYFSENASSNVWPVFRRDLEALAMNAALHTCDEIVKGARLTFECLLFASRERAQRKTTQLSL